MTDSDEQDITPELAHMLFDHHMKYRALLVVPIWKKEREVQREQRGEWS